VATLSPPISLGTDMNFDIRGSLSISMSFVRSARFYGEILGPALTYIHLDFPLISVVRQLPCQIMPSIRSFVQIAISSLT